MFKVDPSRVGAAQSCEPRPVGLWLIEVPSVAPAAVLVFFGTRHQSVDLVDVRRAPLRVRGRVLEEGRLLYSADEPARVAFEVRTRSEYFDFLPTQRAHREEFLRRVAAKGLDG